MTFDRGGLIIGGGLRTDLHSRRIPNWLTFGAAALPSPRITRWAVIGVPTR